MIGLPNTLRPGVFATGHLLAAYGGGDSRGVLAVATGREGLAAGAREIRTLGEAADYGADSPLYQMLAALLDAGASPVYASPVGGGYDAAFAACEPLEAVRVLVCDGGAQALPAHLERCAAAGRERFGVLAAGLPDAPGLAKAMNCRRAAVCCDGGGNTARTAAMFAAAIAARGAGQGYNGLMLPLDAQSWDGALDSGQVESLLAAGVTPFVRLGDRVECVRAVTSCTSVDGRPSRAFADLCAALAADEVLRAVRQAVTARLKGQKNTAATRESMASQILVELESKRAQGVIDSYRPPLVRAHPQDPAVCVAELRLTVAPELAQLVLSAEILM